MANRDSVSNVLPRASLALGLSFVLGVTAACGDDLEPLTDTGDDDADEDDGGSACVSTEVEEFPDGPLGRPDDLVVKGFECPAGGLAEVDLSGRWTLGLDKPFIRESCEDGFEIDLGAGQEALVHRDDTNLFVRTENVTENFSFIVAFRACAVAGSDELTAVFGGCFQITGADEAECFTEPGTMKRFGRPPGEAEADGLELVAEWAGGDAPWPQGTATNVKVVDGVAFLSRAPLRPGDVGDLRLIDVSDPSSPRDLGSIAGGGPDFPDFNDVKLFQVDGRTHALLAGTTSPIVDAGDPANPVVVSELQYSHSVFVREDADGRPLAYLATTAGTPDVPIYDLSDPAMPVLLERVALPPSEAFPGSPGIHDLYAEEDRLYLNAEGDGFIVMDRQGEDWTVGGRLPSTFYSHATWVGDIDGRPIAITGDEGPDAHMQIVDVDPASEQFMTVLATYQTRPDVSIHNIMLLGSRAYITYYHDGVRIIDLADPTDPQLVAYYNTWDVETGASEGFASAIGLDVDVEAGLIYVADMERGLLILRETK